MSIGTISVYVVVLYFVRISFGLLCFNGTFSHYTSTDDPFRRNTIFSSNSLAYARLRCSKTVLCKDNAMCFVRSWVSRAKHAWIVQRGCYQMIKDDQILRTLTVPTRAMSCKQERLPDGEYKVCLCQADWCNTVQSMYTVKNTLFLFLLLFMLLQTGFGGVM